MPNIEALKADIIRALREAGTALSTHSIYQRLAVKATRQQVWDTLCQMPHDVSFETCWKVPRWRLKGNVPAR